jgi:hypothetical protein
MIAVCGLGVIPGVPGMGVRSAERFGGRGRGRTSRWIRRRIESFGEAEPMVCR